MSTKRSPSDHDVVDRLDFSPQKKMRTAETDACATSPRTLLEGEGKLDQAIRAAILSGDCAAAITLCREQRVSDAVSQSPMFPRSECTLLHLAVSCGDAVLPVTLALVLEFDFDPSIELVERGRPLHIAAGLGSAAILTLRFLLTCRTCKVDTLISSYSSKSALSVACEAGHVETIRVLLTRGGANPNLVDGVDCSALDYACEPKHAVTEYAAARELLTHSRVLALRPNTLFTIIRRNVDWMIRGTLAKHTSHQRLALVREKYDGMTSLIAAAHQGCDQTIEPLLAAGAWSPDHRRLGMNAIEIARSRGHDAIAQRIELHAALLR